MNKKKSILIPAMLSILSVAVFSGTALSPLGPFTFSTMQISLATFGLSSFWGLGRFISNLNKDIKEEEKTNTQKKIKSKNNNDTKQKTTKKKKAVETKKTNQAKKNIQSTFTNASKNNEDITIIGTKGNEVTYKEGNKFKRAIIIGTKGNEVIYKDENKKYREIIIVGTKENKVIYKDENKIYKSANLNQKLQYSYNPSNNRKNNNEITTYNYSKTK